MQKINILLNQSVKKFKIEDKVKAQQVCTLWEKVISGILPGAQGKTMAISLDKGILSVASLSVPIADQIVMCQKRLIYELNTTIGKNLVYRINCSY